MTDWRSIVEKHGPAVWQAAYRLLGNEADTADCFQETFVSALEVSRRQHVRNFSALLMHLATVRAMDQLRQRFRTSRFSANLTEVSEAVSSNPGPADQAQCEELAQKLRIALSRLPSQEAEVFCLRCFNRLSYRQIAQRLSIKKNVVGVLLHRARTKLRQLLRSVVVSEVSK